ncbi:copper resistance protein CopC [Geodermatophilus sp. YIM 151500]|uniref:copper resistance CopC/CopD family protein n=1 Tax=Geodermatophilus sp. YIM 151500 TaxID=2984531 RepID=UPI0021E3866A|nr:copper resistance CopC family protein [Geodermatophilus sp. YIM 151500]MCV2490807.1 copper resistance protein CopC [Geodermatophilus sp. YIM 151500]
MTRPTSTRHPSTLHPSSRRPFIRRPFIRRPLIRHPAARRLPVLFALLAGWLLAGVLGAGPAAAHAELVSTAPGEGAELAVAPASVVLEFTESVSLGAGYARVLDGDGDRVDTGAPSVDGSTVTIPLRHDLPDDGYLVTYRVISTDSHPVSGAFGFVVGDAEPVDEAVADAADDGDALVTGLLVVARWLGFAGLALGAGIPAFLLLCWPEGWAAPRLHRAAVIGAGLVAAGAALLFLLQGPYAAGAGLGVIADPDLLVGTAATPYGLTLLFRVVVALALLTLLRLGATADRAAAGPSRAVVVVGTVLAAGLVVATAAVGHPVAGPLPAFAVLVTSVHVAAMTVWVGGLVALLAGLLRPGIPAAQLGTALTRFSRLAFGAVTALVLSGVAQTVRELGSLSGLVSTAYGRVLLAKVLLVLLVLGAAGVSRVWVQQHLGAPRPRRPGRRVTAHAYSAEAAADAGGAPDPDPTASAARLRAEAQADGAVEDVGPFRRSVLLEAAVVAVVLALSAVLAGTPPARSALAQPDDAILPLQTGSGEAGTVQVSLDPARPGANSLHLYLYDEEGLPAQPQELRVTLTEEQQEIGPLSLDLAGAGPGHYVSLPTIPTAGTWTLAVSVRLDEFTAATARTSFSVR